MIPANSVTQGPHLNYLLPPENAPDPKKRIIPSSLKIPQNASELHR